MNVNELNSISQFGEPGLPQNPQTRGMLKITATPLLIISLMGIVKNHYLMTITVAWGVPVVAGCPP